MRRRLLAFIVVSVFAAPAASWSQGLATVAKKEEERRKVAKSGKVYTNTDLKADITASPSVPAPGNASPPQPAEAPAASPADSTQVPSVNLPGGTGEAAPAARNEAYWRERMAAARSALDRSRIFAEALQSRLNALASDIVNRDDPAQRSQLELERQRALAEQSRLNREIDDQHKAIAAIEEEARKAGVPPGWLR